MKKEKILELCDFYHAELARLGAVAKKCDENSTNTDLTELRDHQAWVCEYTKKLADRDTDVASQYLGSIQGVLRAIGDFSYEELRMHGVYDMKSYDPIGAGGGPARSDLPAGLRDMDD